jgi:crotonobetainyl-CoA:carnitine CoA-transferase CaiB-like acyl-CoA transferase
MQFELKHATAGRVASVANPIRLSKTPVTYDKSPPTLGQHTEQVLSELLELDSKQIGDLKGEGVIA